MKLKIILTVACLLGIALFTGYGLGYDVMAARTRNEQPVFTLPVQTNIKYTAEVRQI